MMKENIFYHGDCLFVLEHDIDTESIDLIYLDPPFFTGKVQKGKWQPEAMEISYEDSKKFWAEKADVMREKAPMWLRHIALQQPDFASYLYYIMVRLQACHKVLKKAGSICLHCDYRASHYLRMVMDEVFGYHNFINEIIWCFKSGGASPAHRYSRKHHTIFLYTKSKDYYFKGQQEKSYNRGLKPYRFKGVKEYQDEKGWYTVVGMKDWWEIDMVGRTSHERTGYPTQKPDALLERIIEGSSKEGGIVLDPFCGCGTAMIAASKLNRKYIGIDIDTSPRKKDKMPTTFQVISHRSHSLFQQPTQYVTRDLTEVSEMDGHAFEAWVNEFYKATKPQPDRGVDGIMYDGTPIQSKVYEIKYAILSQFMNDVKHHPKVQQPVKKIIAVSQTGFDDSARKLKFSIETKEGVQIDFQTPETMLGVE